jgi:type IV secretory pathway TrbD component
VNPKQRIILLNAGVVGGLAISYFRGAPIWIVAICGVFLFVLANVTALIKIRKDQAKANISH